MKVLPSFALNDISGDVSTARKIAQLGITGNTQNRFIQAAVLLHLLDPVRGEPTAYGLDRDPNEIEPQRLVITSDWRADITLISIFHNLTFSSTISSSKLALDLKH